MKSYLAQVFILRNETKTLKTKWIAAALIVLPLTVNSFSQQIPPGQTPTLAKMSRPPLSHIYMHFLLYQNHLDQIAAAREAEGKKGSELRDHFQQKLGFTPQEFAIVRTTGVRLESELKEHQARVMALAQDKRTERIQTLRQQNMLRPNIAQSDVTPSRMLQVPGQPNQINIMRTPDPQAVELRKQREDLIQNEITLLNQRLSPQAAAKLHDFLDKDFIRSVSRTHSDFRPSSKIHIAPQSQPEVMKP